VLQSSSPVGILGHESGFSTDGNTFYAASIATGHLTAVDVSNPKLPKTLWTGQYFSHGLSLSEDGNRAYLAVRNGAGPSKSSAGLIILDTSPIQSRVANPTPTVVSTLTWDTVSIPQNAIPVTINGTRYVVEVDEFSSGNNVGMARVIDISDEANPHVVSNIRLEANMPENKAAQAGDPGANDGLKGYTGHYCNVPTRVDPGIVACSFILSGLRVFDIRDPFAPKEIAYFNPPVRPGNGTTLGTGYAMSSPSFVPERSEIWYSDGYTGFYALKVTNGVWPFPSPAPAGVTSG
jgi:hypothetical protein